MDTGGDGTPLPGRIHRKRRRGNGLATGKNRGWSESVKLLAGVGHKHPQSAYAGLQKFLQQEWAFVQRVTPGVREAFVPVEEALREIFVPALFEGLREGVVE